MDLHRYNLVNVLIRSWILNAVRHTELLFLIEPNCLCSPRAALSSCSVTDCCGWMVLHGAKGKHHQTGIHLFVSVCIYVSNASGGLIWIGMETVCPLGAAV